MHDGNSPSERNFFRSHKNLRGVAASFWCLWCCYDSLYELDSNTLALMLQKIKERKKRKNQANGQNTTTKNTFPMFQWVQCPVSTLSRSSNLWEKKIWKNKNGFNVCFQNKANVPITIINCGVCLKLEFAVTCNGRKYLLSPFICNCSSLASHLVMRLYGVPYTTKPTLYCKSQSACTVWIKCIFHIKQWKNIVSCTKLQQNYNNIVSYIHTYIWLGTDNTWHL